jgi:hypothetical protein
MLQRAEIIIEGTVLREETDVLYLSAKHLIDDNVEACFKLCGLGLTFYLFCYETKICFLSLFRSF